MAAIRKELAVRVLEANKRNIHDYLVENIADFGTDEELTTIAGTGSLAYCLEDGNVYVRLTRQWQKVGDVDASIPEVEPEK